MTAKSQLLKRIKDRSAIVGIVGMGYVGLPLAVAAHRAGYAVVGFDTNPQRVAELNKASSPIGRISDQILRTMLDSKRFSVTSDYARFRDCDVIIICVPTPLNRHREPDLSYIVQTTQGILPHLRQGQLISLESTTYPGTTRDVMRPILEESGLKSGTDFFLAFSPEREDPGNADFHTATIPKVVGGHGDDACEIAEAFYSSVVNKVVPVANCEIAEAVKLTENIFRSVNIALVNELKIVYSKMGINVWDVIDAAKTKPFGYMPFYPGPGLGGHCIPIDPFYLAWKAREFEVPTRFIELAGEINTHAPYKVIETLIDALSNRSRKSIKGARILLFGIAYKKNVEDMRESPAITLIRLIEERGGIVDYYDPYIPEVPNLRDHPEMIGRKSVTFNPKAFTGYDAGLICTDHGNVDYNAIADSMAIVVDTRNALRDVADRSNIVMA